MPTNYRIRGLLALAALIAAAPLLAQQKGQGAPAKKLYCWDENGTRVCGDALPADAVNRARQEFNAKSGMRTADVQRAQTSEEMAAAAVDAQRTRAEAAAAETRRRTEQALLTSYASEEELRRVFNERTGIVANNIETARFNVASLRDGLVTLLQNAAERELSGKPVAPKLAGDIQQRHTELQQQLRLQAEYERQRVELDGEIEQIMVRYRELKGVAVAPAAALPAETAAPAKQQ